MQFDVEAVLFDNDGVLVDSHDLVEAAWRLLAEEFDLRIEVLLSELAGVRAADTLGRHLDPYHARAAVARLEDIEVDLAGRRGRSRSASAGRSGRLCPPPALTISLP